MRLIDADKLHDAIEKNWAGVNVCKVKDILKFIDKIPTEKDVEIIKWAPHPESFFEK